MNEQKKKTGFFVKDSNDVVSKNQSQETGLSVKMFEGFKTGFEETNTETFKTPFVKVLQALSPEVQKGGNEFIEGAIPSLFCNTATKHLYDEIDVIVLKITHNLVVWKPNRGGFIGVFDKALEEKITARRDGIKKYDKDENIINDTISFFCLNAQDMSDLFVIALSNASMKHAKGFSTSLRMLKLNGQQLGVSFAGVWNIKTVLEKNDKGSWYSIGSTPTFKRFITPEEFENSIKPALEMLTKAETDYSQMENKDVEDDSVQY